MKIVIDIPEKVYDRFCRCCRFPDEVEEAILAITDGTPLPNELIDEGQYAEGHSEHAYECPYCHKHMIGYADRINFCPICGLKLANNAEEDKA